MKAITIGAEYAHLIARGVKTIETRSRPCRYRGRVAIHAAARIHGKPGPLGDFHVERDMGGWMIRGASMAWPYRLPTGAIVAVADLVDCVPIIGNAETRTPPSFIAPYVNEGDMDHQRGGLWLIGVNERTTGMPTCVEDEAPYGDYTPGRFGLLLDNVRRIRPVAARGQQSVPWNVPADVAERVQQELEAVTS